MAVPKNKKSKSKTRMRNANKYLKLRNSFCKIKKENI